MNKPISVELPYSRFMKTLIPPQALVVLLAFWL